MKLLNQGKLRNDVSREVEKERNPQQNELNNGDVAIEGEHAGLPHNIIPTEENAIEQPNDINENELLKIRYSSMLMQKASLLLSIKDST